MPALGRLCRQFSGLLSSSLVLSAPQSEHRLAWNVYTRSYTRKSNLAKKAKKAAERALKKQEKKVIRTARTVKPFPSDPCADNEPSTDNVWFQHLHPLRQLTFEDAISYHQESVHKTVYNNPGAFVNVIAVLNLKTRKQNIILDKLKGSYMPAHLFPSGIDLRILAICKETVDIEESLEAGAFTAGGLDLIKKIEEGNILVEEYDTVVAHTDVLTNLAPIRGLMKTKMPRANLGTLGSDMMTMITRVKESRTYKLFCDSENKHIGWVDDAIGRLNMPPDHLRENLGVYLRGILNQQPRVDDLPFIKELYVRCPSTDEVFLLNRSSVLKEEIRELATNKDIVQEFIAPEPADKPNKIPQE